MGEEDARVTLVGVRELVGQMAPVHRRLRRMEWTTLFQGRCLSREALECWVELEKLIELSEELGETLGIKVTARTDGRTAGVPKH